MRTRQKVAAVGLLVVGMTAVAAQAAGAADTVRSWNSESAPLTAKGYGSTGRGFGQWKVSTGTDGTKSRLYANLRIDNPHDHSVYAKLTTQTNAGYCFSPDYVTCDQKWYAYDTSDTAHYNGYTWRQLVTRTNVSRGGDFARAVVRVCLDIPYRADVCSGDTFTKGGQY